MLEIETPAQEQTTYINKVEATSNGSNITYNTLGHLTSAMRHPVRACAC